MPQDSLDFMFNPKSIAVIGASQNPKSFGMFYLQHLIEYGYKGTVYPINPKLPEVMGFKAYPSINQVPGPVDYVIYCIALNNLLEILPQCQQKDVKVVHIMAGKGAETGRAEAKQLEADIQRLGKEIGIRLLGPNCLGVYCPKSGLSFGYDFPKEPGEVGAILQSGGNSTDLIRFGSLRGLRFSKVVSYGNGLDINQNDLLEYFTKDEDTKIILFYMEGLKGDPKRFLKLLKAAAQKKPVVICKAGRTSAGTRQSLSHTASLAGSSAIFKTAIKQSGAMMVNNLDELIDQAVAFSFLPAITGRRVALGGGGGGRNVLTSDEWEEHGFQVPALPQEIREEWKKRGSQIWDWLENPADFSITPGDICTIADAIILMSQNDTFDFIVATVTEDMPFARDYFLEEINVQTDGFIKAKRGSQKGFAVVFTPRPMGAADMDHWRWKGFAEARTRMLNEKIASFATVSDAAKAIDRLINYYQQHKSK
jgi:acyl-CoA synthetase (NDP forming)